MHSIWLQLPKPFLALAPMEGVTDTVFRQVVIKAGRPDIMFTEFTSVDGLASRGMPFVAHRLRYEPGEKPLIAQLWGTVPENYFRAAAMIKTMGFDGIDINMACPVKDVMKTGGGAALIDQPELARDIIEATRRGAGGLPVSVKTRLGRREVNLPWIEWLLASDIDALTVHGRTAKEMSRVPAHWDVIGEIVKMRNGKFSGPRPLIIGNGDVESVREAREKARLYGLDGVMVGRGVMHNPWVFATGISVNNKDKRIDLLRYHVDLFERTWGKEKPFVVLRKYLQIYARGFRGATKLRTALMAATCRDDVENILGRSIL